MIEHRRWHWIAMAMALVVVAALSVALGSIRIPLSEVLRAVIGEGDAGTIAIIRTLRVPRVALALLVGAGLGMSGAALQGSLRNPLAEPYLLGVSGGAAVGAVIAFAAGFGNAGGVALSAFAGAAIAVGLAIAVARSASLTPGDPRALLMAGVIIGAFANAVIMIALSNAPPNTVRGALWWMMGSVADADWWSIRWLAAYVTLGGGALMVWAREIDLLSLGSEAAASLGVDSDRSGRRIFLLSALLAAATVAAAGLIGFVGLVVPHIARGFGVRRHRPLIAASALVGATLVVAADVVARTAMPPGELPLGAVTALIGVPFFLVQLRRIR